MSLIDGLYTYEVVLLVCGVILFAALIIVLLRQVFTNRPYNGLLLFFVLPIAMIGFPAITKLQISNGMIEIDKQTQALLNKPQDASTRTALQTEVAKIAGRPIVDPDTLTTLAKAQFALAQDQEAEANVTKALSTNPNLAAATELKNKIDLTKTLTALTSAAASQPDNPRVREELQNTYTKLSQQKVANPKVLETMSKARLVLEKQGAATPAK
jgi:hypothetical protein